MLAWFEHYIAGTLFNKIPFGILTQQITWIFYMTSLEICFLADYEVLIHFLAFMEISHV